MGSHDKKVPLADRLKKYIEEGGFLVTTGRSLDTIIADLFPDIIGFEKQEIKGGAFKGEISSLEHPFIQEASKKKALKFWIEDKSHPIKKVKPDITDLVFSKKLEKKHGSGAVVVSLTCGGGTVVYMLSQLHSPKSNEQLHYTNAYMISNILDEAVTRAIPDEIASPSDMTQMAYVNMVVIDDPSKECVFCGSAFKDYDGKVLRCGACGTHYHEFCLDQQLSREGVCKEFGRLLVYEKFKNAINAGFAPAMTAFTATISTV